MKKLIRKYWYIVVLVVILIITIILRFLTPTTTQTPSTQTSFNSYQGVVPGSSTQSEVIAKLGNPKSIENTATGAVLSYQSDYPAFPTQVVIENSVVGITKERVSRQNSKGYKELIQSYGVAEGIGYTDYLGQFFPVSIYASKGVAVAKHEQGDVFEFWRFPPMTVDQFFATVGKDLSRTPEGPEPIGDGSQASESAAPRQ